MATNSFTNMDCARQTRMELSASGRWDGKPAPASTQGSLTTKSPAATLSTHQSSQLSKLGHSHESLFSSLGSRILKKLSKFRFPSCRHAKSYVVQTWSEQYPDLDDDTDSTSGSSSLLDKFKTSTCRRSGPGYPSPASMRSASTTGSSCTSTTSGSYCLSAQGEDGMTRRLDRQLLRLENLVRSLEDLEKQLEQEELEDKQQKDMVEDKVREPHHLSPQCQRNKRITWSAGEVSVHVETSPPLERKSTSVDLSPQLNTSGVHLYNSCGFRSMSAIQMGKRLSPVQSVMSSSFHGPYNYETKYKQDHLEVDVMSVGGTTFRRGFLEDTAHNNKNEYRSTTSKGNNLKVTRSSEGPAGAFGFDATIVATSPATWSPKSKRATTNIVVRSQEVGCESGKVAMEKVAAAMVARRGGEAGGKHAKDAPVSGLPPKFPRPTSPQLKLETIVVDEVLAAAASDSPTPRVRPPGLALTRTPTPIPAPGDTKKVRGIWCENCNSRLVELKKQAVKLWMPFVSRKNTQPYTEADLIARVEEKLYVPDKLRRQLHNDKCSVCDTGVRQLKEEAIIMVQSLDRTQTELGPAMAAQGTGGGRGVVQLPRTTPHYTPANHRLIRQGLYNPSSPAGKHASGIPTRSGSPQLQKLQSPHRSASPQHRSGALREGYSHPSRRTPSPYPWNQIHNNKRSLNQMMANSPTGLSMSGRAAPMDPQSPAALRPEVLALQAYPQMAQSASAPGSATFSPAGSTSSAGSSSSLAASFFARAAQKLHISSRKKKKHSQQPPMPPEPPPFPTNFGEIIRLNPPPAPPFLLRAAGKMQNPGTGKVKVMLRICPVEGNHSSFLNVDQRNKQITLYDPAYTNGFTTPSQRRAGVTAPKMFAFDAVFSQDDSLAEMCASSLVEIIQAVVNGADGCLFCYGHARLGKTYSMIGVDDKPQNLGMIPSAITWLFRLINEQKEKTGARFSVRVSAVEVTGKQEKLKDLLADVASQENSFGTAPGMYLREDPISGTQVENQSELRAPTADRAAYYLDAAIASRTIPEAEEDARHSHLLFTLHVYQYRVDKTTKAPQGTPNVAGGRSRLHLIDLGSCSKSNKEGSSGLTLTALGNVILALLNGQRHLPYRESKLTSLIRDALGNLSCRTCMIAHVSPNIHSYNETLQVVQLAARIHRLKRRKTKFSSTSSEDSSSCDDSVRLRSRYRTGIRMGVLREDALLSHSDPDYTSSSEQSCDTVIYVGRHGQVLSDRELTDNEGPPAMVPIVPRPRPTMGISGSRSSGDESDSKASKLGANMVSSRLPTKTVAKMSPVVSTGSRTNYNTTNPVSVPSSQWKGMEPPSPYKSADTTNVKSVNQGWPQDSYKANSGKSEQWIDGPCTSVSVGPPGPYGSGPPPYSTKPAPPLPPPRQTHTQQPHSQEHWIDGPNMKPSPAPQPDRQQELWVDGPREFYADSKSMPNRGKSQRPHHRMWTEKSESHHHHHHRSSRHHHHRSESAEHGGSPKPVSHDAVEHTPRKTMKPQNPVLAEVAAMKDGARPVSQVSVESATSLNVNTESRPVSATHSVEQLGQEAERLEEICKEAVEPLPHVKSFVRDWVEKHSALPMEGKSSGKHSRHASPQHTSRQTETQQVTKDDMMILKKSTHSPDRYVNSAQSSPRLRRIRKNALPPPIPNSNDRTLAWVQSVQDAAATKLKDLQASSECNNNHTSANTNSNNVLTATSENAQEESDVNSPQLEDEDPPPDYASVVESIESEAREQELEALTSQAPVFDKDRRLHLQHDLETRSQRSDAKSQRSEPRSCKSEGGKVWCTADELRKGKLTNANKAHLDVNTLIMTNRESIYELQMDDKLENTRNSMGRLAINSEDEISWNGSLRDKCRDLDTSGEAEDLDKDENANEGVEAMDVALSPLVNDNHHVLEPLSVKSTDNQTCTDHLSPPSSEDSEKVMGRKLARPTCLRCPDGASNPNLSSEDPEKPLLDSSPEVITETLEYQSPGEAKGLESIMERSVDGQSPEDSLTSLCEKEEPSPSCKPPMAPTTKPSVLPKPSNKTSKPAVPPRTTSRLSSPSHSAASTPSKSEQNSPCRTAHSSRNTSPAKTPVGSPSRAVSPPSKKEAKSLAKQHKESTSPVSSSSSKSKSSKSRLPSFSGRSKSQPSPTKSSSSSGKESKSSRTSSKSPSPSKKDKKESKKDSKKDSKLPVSKSSSKSRHVDSDSGNDSGIVKNDKKPEKKLLSPYHKITKPRISMHSSSGHGSDASSNVSGVVVSKAGSKGSRTENSSGYESMLRDSEASGSSSNHDSNSESSITDKLSLSPGKMLKKKAVGKRSRSAPGRSRPESPVSSAVSSPSVASTRVAVTTPASPRAWVDTRRVVDMVEMDVMEIKVYNIEDVERLARRRKEEAELRALELRRERIGELLAAQDRLKVELEGAKNLLMVHQDSWSYDLHVAEHMDRDDPDYLEALEKETSILEKRVEACKSRIMMVTCFDVNS